MKKYLFISILIISLFFSFKSFYSEYFHIPVELVPQSRNFIPHTFNETLIDSSGQILIERIRVPSGYERINKNEDSFGNYLRNLPLKKDGSKVHYFNGGIKSADVHAAVINMEIGIRDLQQCADACIRLRSEYLFKENKLNNIHFNFTNGFNAEFLKWREGYRIAISGNKVSWKKSSLPDYSYSNFRKYLNIVFAYAGTISLSGEMEKISIKDLDIGDVFIEGGSPGHAVIVADVAKNINTGEKIYLLAQSYMPAQEIHIIKNPNGGISGPWYALNDAEKLITPEWIFSTGSLKRFTN